MHVESNHANHAWTHIAGIRRLQVDIPYGFEGNPALNESQLVIQRTADGIIDPTGVDIWFWFKDSTMAYPERRPVNFAQLYGECMYE